MAITRRLRVEFSGEHSDLEVVLPDDATIATLIDLLGATTDDLMVDGRIVQPWQGLAEAGVWDGAVVDLDQIPESDVLGLPPVVALDKIAGNGGSVSQPLAPGTHEFGRDEEDDSRFALLVGDRGAVTVLPRSGPIVVDNVRITGPTALDDQILIVGGSRYRIGPPSVEGSLPAAPVAPTSRRRVPVSTKRRVRPAALPRPASSAPPRMWLNVVPVCLILGVLGIIVHPAFFAAAGLALLCSFGLLWHERNERVAERQARNEQAGAVVENFARHVSAERRSVAVQLRAEHPHIPDLARDAALGAPNFFQRQADEHDFGRVAVGYGDTPWQIGIDSDFVLEPPLQAVVDANNRLASVPIEIDLTDGPIGIVGPNLRAVELARALSVAVCSQWGPGDVRLALATEATELERWDWCKWAPHLDGDRHVATSVDEADRMVSSWRTPGHDWLQLVFVDQPKWVDHPGSLLSTISREPGRQCLIVLAETVEELPWCSTRMELQPDGTMSVTSPDHDRIDFVSPRHADIRSTEQILRAAAWRDRGERHDASAPPAYGVRPFQLEASSSDDFVELSLDPPPVPPKPSSPDPAPAPAEAAADVSPAASESGPSREEPDTEPVQPTVIRVAATSGLLDGAALTPPLVPPPPPVLPEEDDIVIDLRDEHEDVDDASGGSGTRWTRPRS